MLFSRSIARGRVELTEQPSGNHKPPEFFIDLKDKILASSKFSLAEQLLGRQEIDAPLSKESDSLPPILQAAFEQAAGAPSYIRDFEALTIALRAHVFGLESPINAPASGQHGARQRRTYDANDVKKAVVAAANELMRIEPPNAAAASLKLVGVELEGDLDLSKLDLPFSVRLICCHIKGALIVDRSSLVTLDVSGSIVQNGISGNYTKCGGALRARRLVSLGPVDFGGAEIGGSVDLTDSVIYPENSPTHRASYVADRGILNLSLAKLRKDCRLARARIYGGVNLRGCTIDGMLFMNDAVFRCPIAHFELMMDCAIRLVAEELKQPSFVNRELSIAAKSSMDADLDIAKTLHQSNDHDPANALTQKVEVLGGASVVRRIWASDRSPEPFRLLQESRRTAESAVRAEGLTVAGPVYALGLRVCGRFRLKGLRCGGGLSFNGSRFRTVRSLRRDIKRRVTAINGDESWEGQVKHNTGKLMKAILIASADPTVGVTPGRKVFRKEYALDLRDAKIGGPLDLAHDPRHRRIEKLNCDKVLLRKIAEALCKSGEDPVKFIPVFTASKTGRDAKHHKGSDDQLLVESLEAIAVDCDPEYYALEKAEETALRNKIKAERALEDTRMEHKEVADRIEEEKSRGMSEEDLLSSRNKLRRLKAKIVDCREELLQARITYVKQLDRFPPEDTSKRRVDGLNDTLATKICDAVEKHGTLNATMVIGEIRLVNAEIRGGLILSSLIANVVEETSRPASNTIEEVGSSGNDRRLINMKNITIKGDVDLTNSIGVSSISAKQAVIRGSVKFCHKPRYSNTMHRYRPLRARAFFPATENTRTVINFERCQIGGDGVFLFDRDKGPNLFLASARIGEKLQILPARFGLQISNEDIRKIFKHRNRGRNSQEAGGGHVRRSFLTALGLSGHFKSRISEQVLNEMNELSESPPQIDLRGTRVIEFSHPPSAWPKPDGLLIKGLTYERISNLGPIAPAWRSWPRAWSRFHDHLNEVWRHRLAWSIGTIGSISSGLVLFGVAMLPNFRATVRDNIGGLNLLFGVVLVAAGLIYLTLNVREPNRAQDRHRLATLWLGLQRRHFNTNRVLEDSRPHEPYLQASSVLRGQGHNDAADIVEIERLRERTRDLSLRRNFIPKVLLQALDWFIGYGFRPVRASLVVLTYVLLSSIFFHHAEHSGAIAAQPAATTATIADVDLSEKHFNSFWYTLDIFVPMLAAEADVRWVLTTPEGDDLVAWSYHFALVIRFFGWLLITLAILAVAARIETMFARFRLRD